MMISLYGYQLEGIEKLKTGSILCGGVGSGKSRTALAYYYTKVGHGCLGVEEDEEFSFMNTPKPLYIITTARKRDTCEWDKELMPFLLSTNPKVSQCGTPVVIDSWNNITKYVDVKNAFFIFDEQKVSGSGVWAKTFIKIARVNEWILLSATPGDVWIDYAPVFIANGFYRNFTDFRNQHVIYNTHLDYPKIDRYVGVKKLERHRKSILVDMHLKRSTIRHYENIEVSYDPELYNAVKKRWNPFRDRPIKNAGEYCYTMRKAVNRDSTRSQAIIDIYKKHRRVIVFYNFDYELEILKEMCSKIKAEYAEWNGCHHDLIPQTDEWIYLVQYTAGAEGWNCIETNTVVFYSLNYSYKVMSQSAGRIDRLNTPYIDLYYYILMSNTDIDQAIQKSLTAKKTFNEKGFVKF